MAGLEWRPTDSLLVRGSYATSFRAPEMYQVYSKGSEGLAQRVDALRCIQNGDINNCIGANGDNEDPAVSNWYDIIITSKGSPLLESEEGESFTYGVVWDVMDNWSLSVDYWNIELKNAISTVGEDEVLAAEAGCATGLTVTGDTYLNPNTGSAPDSEYCALMTARVHRDGPNNAITMVEVGPFNKAGMRREGIDLATRYRLATGLGNFTFALNYTNLLKASERASEASDWSNGKDGAHHGSDWHTKTRASIGWDKDNWNAMLLATRLPQRRSGNFELNGYLPAQVIYNLTAGYRITDSMGVNFA
ncbi:MAG: TonB-dependent receptor, partial [Planctomycetes bacterium]|nr:TonB-dependent receptor [Planctomycetota bacterium]